MKLKIIIGLVVVAAICVIGAFIVEHTRTIVLGNMQENVEEKTANTEIDFPGRGGEAVKVSVKTTVKSGTIKFKVSDSKGNIISDLGTADAMEVFVDLPYDDTYTLTAVCVDYSGKYSVKVTQRRY